MWGSLDIGVQVGLWGQIMAKLFQGRILECRWGHMGSDHG